jgi:4-hydroxy-tetrahydrodipicolinate synthase
MYHGSIVALVTPMTSAGAIDYASLDKLFEWHLSAGTDALVVAGSTGESGTLSQNEKNQLIEYVVKQVGNRIPIIAGTATNSTAATIENTLFAMNAGVDACLISTPAYIKPTQQGLYEHYRSIADAAALPIILYNVPSRTACDLQVATIVELAKIPNIIGIKEATADMARAEEIMLCCGDKLDVYSGDDATALPLMMLGGKGVISVTANVAPKQMKQMCAAVLSNDLQRAKNINAKLNALHQALFCESNPIPVKWCLSKMGLIPEGIRLPLTPLSTQHHARLTQVLAALELI